MSTDYRRTLVTGSFWIALSEVLKAVAELSSSVIAARILAPSDFGLMGAVLLTIAVLENFSKTGFDQALIQKQESVEPYLNVAWTWHVLRGCGLALALALLAPLIADWYDEPSLKWLIWATTLQVVVQGFQNVGMLFFSRELNFKKICFVNVLQATASAGVAIPAILYFQNVWGLVWGLVASGVVTTVVSFLVHPWRPSFEWDYKRFSNLTKFGKWITGLSVIGFLVTQGDDIFISKFVGLEALAFYQLAYSISNLPATKITHVISRVSFPTYSRLQEQPDELKAVFVGVMRTTLLISAPLSVTIYLVGPGIVEHIIGAKWSPILPLIEILVVAAFVRSFAALGGALFQACDRPDLDFKMNLPRFIILCILLWPLTEHWGLEGACLGVLLSICGCLPVWFYGVNKLSGLTVWQTLKLNWPAFVLALGLFIVWLFVGKLFEGVEPSFWAFLTQVASTLLIWLLSTRVVGRVSPEMDVVTLLKSILKS